jgi:trans-aconitate 2-methyltransferase
MSQTREWDGRSYDRISTPMEELGREALARLPLRGDEVVIDAGCGSGRITELLLKRLPRGRVIALDASSSMVKAARERLKGIDVRLVDLLELELQEPVDAILSTATFHWIADHERLFRRLRAALRPGGRLVAQCGGEGNIEILRGRAGAICASEPYAEHFRGWRAPWNYAGPLETRRRLLDAGFSLAECWLSPAPKQPEQAREFLATIVLGPHVQLLPQKLREPFMDDVLDELGEPVIIDYVRLNIDATA